MKSFIIVAIITICIVGAKCAIPNYVKICPRKGDNSKCLKDNFKAVMSHLIQDDNLPYKLQNLKSIHVDKLPMQATPQLQITLEDLIFTGLENVEMIDFNIDPDKQIVSMKLKIPRVEYSGKYDMNGRILILPIQGVGTMNITHVGVQLSYNAPLKTQQRQGKTYFTVDKDKTSVKFENHKRTYYQFDNLFGGDPKLGPEMNVFLNENWLDVFKEAQSAFEFGMSAMIITPYVNGFLRNIPIDELFTN